MMILTKDIILAKKGIVPGIEGYNLVISKIEGNLTVNPDIAIESCKSLIEGLCKKALELVSDKYNSDKQLRGLCEDNMKHLVKTAFNQVYSNGLEANLHESLYHIILQKTRTQTFIKNAQKSLYLNSKSAIDKVIRIRNIRGDLSHGRIYPKKVESEIHLAKSIASITDGICSFMIHEFSTQYEIKSVNDRKLVYDDLADFNNWLDEQNDNLLTKVDFSRLLYLYTYEKYGEIYYGEYAELIENNHEDHIIDELIGDYTKQSIIDDKKGQVEELINTFDEKVFWTQVRINASKDFSQREDLVYVSFQEWLNNFLSFGNTPTIDDLIKLMLKRPPLKERTKVSNELFAKIIDFTETL
ncbi:hypothetical protein HNV12_13885 [Methanococcoides sp. SA1]|nr:hypothetical protein [Methanococcoides sp. SA1]